MRKRKQGRKLARKRGQRIALRKSLAVALIKKERIQTTLPKAKELRPFIEKLITRANQKSGFEQMRYLARYLPKASADKLSKIIAPRFKSRPGGYTRIIKLGHRKSDNAKIALIEFLKDSTGQEAKTALKAKEVASEQKNK